MTLFKEETMLVHPVVVPDSGTRSWTVLGDDDVPVVPVDRFLGYLTDIGRSPNTVKAYAHDLKDYWCFIGFRGLNWREARLEDIGEFIAWLQLPPEGRAGEVAVLPSVTAAVTAATVNRKLAAVSAFYAHQARNGAEVSDLLAVWRTGGRGGWKPFLHHVSKGKDYRGRVIALKAPKKLPRVLTVGEMQAILDACTRLRDRFFFAVLHESGCRVGEVLGLRHEDIAAAECEISIVARENANGARAKSGGRTVPVGPDLIRLYADYLHEEYGGIDSDMVFVNLWAEPKGHAWSYQAVYDLVLRLRARTGIDFDPHWFPALGSDQVAAGRRPDRGRLGPARALLCDCDRIGLRSPDGRGRAGGAGESRLANREGSVVVTGGWITQADRSRWQQRAAAELAVILSGHPDIPVIAWTVTAASGGLSGQVLASAGRRGLFGQWRHALGLDEVTETPSANGTPVYLCARGVRGGVTVSVTATVFDEREDSR
jgi:site-specific recombinase XerD